MALDEKSKPVLGFYEPLTTCAFLANGDLMVCIYHRFQMKQYHFVYSYTQQKIVSKIAVVEIDKCTNKNFPIKSFYSEPHKKFYTFYRQGHCVTVNPENVDDIKQEKLDAMDFGNMYLLYGHALCVRSSGSILFFKIDEKTGLWTLYDRLDKMRGQIYFIKGNVRIQIVTDEYIYFFLIDEKTFKPTLENVMGNFMQCSMMMFGPRVRFSITYKTNQPGFQIYRRKYFHNYRVRLTDHNNEGSKGCNLPSIGKYIMSDMH